MKHLVKMQVYIILLALFSATVFGGQPPLEEGPTKSSPTETSATSETETAEAGVEPAAADKKPGTDIEESVTVYGQRIRTVSATRTDTALIDIPMAIQVVDQEQLQQQQVLDLADVVRNVSGIHKWGSYAGDAGQSDYNIRGFDLGVSGLTQNFRMNGLYTPNGGGLYSDFVERVEIIKGPASVLYGDVAPGGIVNLVTKKPVDQDIRRFEAKIGQDGLLRPSIDLGGRLDSDGRLLYRLNATYEETDSFRDEVHREGFSIAPALTWRFSEETTWTVEAILRDQDRGMDWGFPALLSLEQVEDLPRENFYGDPDRVASGKSQSFISTFEHYFNSNIRLRNTTNVATGDRLVHDVYPVFDFDTGRVGFGWGDYLEGADSDRFSNTFDLMMDFQTGSANHSILVGFDYMTSDDRVSWAFGGVEGSLDLVNPGPDLGSVVPSSFVLPDATNTRFVNRTGINIQDQIQLFDERLHLLLGLRFSDFESGIKYDNPADRPAGEEDTEDDEVVPRLGVLYKARPNISLYASYAESFEVVGVDPGRNLNDPKPVIGEQYEFGFKGNFFGDRFGFTASYFNIDKENVLQFFLREPDLNISDPTSWEANQTGKHNSNGVEIDWHGMVNDRFRLSGSFTFLDTEVKEELVQEPWESTPTDYSGFELTNNPDQAASLWANYDFDRTLDGLTMGLGIFYRGEFYGDRLNTEVNQVPDSTKMDLMLGYSFSKVNLQLNVMNLTDEETFLNQWNLFWQPQPARRAVLSVSTNF